MIGIAALLLFIIGVFALVISSIITLIERHTDDKKQTVYTTEIILNIFGLVFILGFGAYGLLGGTFLAVYDTLVGGVTATANHSDDIIRVAEILAA